MAAPNFNGNLTAGGKPFFDVTFYGAKGDGVNDETTAIQAAITAAANAGGGRVYFPRGTYKCSGQLNIGAAKNVVFIGDGKLASILYYSGATQQPFLIFPGQNHGSAIVRMTVCGYPADPAVQILSNAGSGTNGYQSLVSIEDSWIGYYYPPGGSAPSSYLSYSGLQVQCDVFRINDSDVWGRNSGCRVQQGTTDFYSVNSYFATLPQASEPQQYGLWCDDVGPYYFAGSIHLTNCGFAGAGASTTGARLRSIANLIACYCESSNLPLSAVTGTVRVIGGRYGTSNTTATTLMSFNGCAGTIVNPAFSCPSSGLTSLISATSSVGSWDIFLQDSRTITGTLPTTLVSVDTPNIISQPSASPQITLPHIASEGGTPTCAAGAGLGTSPPTPYMQGTDTRGTINFGTGTTPAAGKLLTVTFATAFASYPVVVLSPAWAASSASLGLFVNNITKTGFEVWSANAPAASQGVGPMATFMAIG